MIVLDTHAWVFFINDPDSLARSAREAIRRERALRGIRVSSMSAWEVLMLEKKGRLKFKIPARVWVENCEKLSFLRFVPVDNTIARLAVELAQPFHEDPADRIIVATALSLGAALVTRDGRILKYARIKTVRA